MGCLATPFQSGIRNNAVINPQPPAAGSWFNTIPASDYTTDINAENIMLWQSIPSLPSSGYCSKLRCFFGASSGGSLAKMAIYLDQNLSAQSAAIPVNAAGYAEFSLSNLPVIGGPWNLAVIINNPNNTVAGKNSVGQGEFANIAFGSFPPSVLPVSTVLNRQIIVGMFVT